MKEHLLYLLANPSNEAWKEIIETGKDLWKACRINKSNASFSWAMYCTSVETAIKAWPPEIERLCPESWPKEFKEAVEHRVIETDTYEHYIAKICGDERLRLADGKTQAVWLERRFTGGVVPVSKMQIALRSLWAALKASSVTSTVNHVKEAINVLTNSVRNVGRVGCADLTGGVIVEQACGVCADCRSHCSDVMRCNARTRHEYRLEVEVKVGKEEQSEAQKTRMRSVQARGGCYVLARSVEEAVQAIVDFRSKQL
jgi:hypothetical protein